MEELTYTPVEGKFLTYLGKPLVREGNTLCYGSKNDKYFMILEIITYRTENNQQIPDRIMIQIVDSKNPMNLLKQGFKNGLSEALKQGVSWLEIANK